MSEGNFTVEHDGAIATLTLDRPDKRNALSPATMLQLKTIAEALREQPEIRAVVIRATGKDFSVGADLGTMGGTPQPTVQIRRTAELGMRLMRALREIPQPVVCAMQGIATGGANCRFGMLNTTSSM